jgi:hypothetical protein
VVDIGLHIISTHPLAISQQLTYQQLRRPQAQHGTQAKHVLPDSYVSFRNGLSLQSVNPAKDRIRTHTVFRNIMQVVSSDDYSTGHFGRHDLASQNTATDGNVTNEGAFLVCG